MPWISFSMARSSHSNGGSTAAQSLAGPVEGSGLSVAEESIDTLGVSSSKTASRPQYM